MPETRVADLVQGFVSRCSRRLLSAVGEAALLCPSLAVAQQMLARRSIELKVKTLRRLCRDLGEAGLARRGEVRWTATKRSWGAHWSSGLLADGCGSGDANVVANPPSSSLGSSNDNS
jgi:hypothetical protein